MIEKNAYGLYFFHSGANKPEYNLIYDNYINNSQNYYNTTTTTNYFNTTFQTGTNILGGPWIGGNYWTIMEIITLTRVPMTMERAFVIRCSALTGIITTISRFRYLSQRDAIRVLPAPPQCSQHPRQM